MNSYDRRTAASPSYLARLLEGNAGQLAQELTAKLQKYTEGPSSADVKVESGFLVIRLWLSMEVGASSYGKPVHDARLAEEAAEVAELFLGQSAVIGPHKLTSNMWVAILKFDLR